MNLEQIITFLVGGAAGKIVPDLLGKILDWLRYGKRDKAEVQKSSVETDETKVRMALTIAKEAKDQFIETSNMNNRLMAENETLRGKVEVLTNSLYEERQQCAHKDLRIANLEAQLKKNTPEDRRPDRHKP